MKKALMFFAMLAAVGFSAHSIAPARGFGIGSEFGNLFARYLQEGNAVSSYTGSIGLNLSYFRFFNRERTIGIFVHNSYAIPVVNRAGHSFTNYDFQFQGGMIVGPVFRRVFSEDLTLHYGIGVNMMTTSFRSVSYSGNVEFTGFRFDLGIGGDVGIRRVLVGNFLLGAGSIFTLDFFRFARVETSLGHVRSGHVQLFQMFAIRPYIKIGLYF